MQPILFTYSQLKAKSVKGFRCSQLSCENGRLRGDTGGINGDSDAIGCDTNEAVLI
jgi:hypothetical protein